MFLNGEGFRTADGVDTKLGELTHGQQGLQRIANGFSSNLARV